MVVASGESVRERASGPTPKGEGRVEEQRMNELTGSHAGRCLDALRDLWGRCFMSDARHDPDERARGEEQWCGQRADHLPLTLGVMTSRGPCEYRYGRSEQGESGRPTLLLMAGFSPEQLALVIAAHAGAGCEGVVPFTGSGVWAAVQEEVASCLTHLGVDSSLVAEPVEIDPGNPADVFRKILRWVREKTAARCAIDCTGGKKPMDSGAAHAASFYGLPAYYLDFEQYDPELRRPLPWTCTYSSLPLPDAVFSLDSRKRVFEAFRARRFGDAHVVMREVLAGGRRSGFFEGAELEDLRSADRMIAKAAAWIDPSREWFSEAPEIEPRLVIEQLLAPERFDEFFCHLAAEYWRLSLLVDCSQDREALVGLVGLAELAVDRLFREPWFQEVRVVKATAVEWLEVKDEPGLPDLGPLAGLPLPVSCLPHSCFGEKLKLLRRGMATLPVRVACGETGAYLRDPPPAFGESGLLARVEVALPNATEAPESPPGQQASRSPLAGPSNKLWKESFGFPHGGWVENRHAVAHLRAPLSGKAVAEVRKACDSFVPRLMEALRRVHNGEDLDWNQVELPDWARWKDTKPWRRVDRAPWAERQADLERWLWLRP